MYRLPVSTVGWYRVLLHFAEVAPAITTIGQRRFDVLIEGQRVLSNYDILFEAGGPNRAVVETFTIPVLDAAVELQFSKRGNENPKISGIELVYLGSSLEESTTSTTAPADDTTTTTTTTTTAPPTTTTP